MNFSTRRVTKLTLRIVLLSFLSLSALGVCADDPAPPLSKEDFEATLRYQHGVVALPQGIATLRIPVGFRYLGPADARRILEQAWGNPQGDGTLGMLFPSAISPLDEQGWGVVITYARARQTLTISTADVEVAGHLDIAVNAPVAEVRRVCAAPDGTVLYLGEVTYRGDYIHLEMDLKP